MSRTVRAVQMPAMTFVLASFVPIRTPNGCRAVHKLA
jgi:hypothetical protein